MVFQKLEFIQRYPTQQIALRIQLPPLSHISNLKKGYNGVYQVTSLHIKTIPTITVWNQHI